MVANEAAQGSVVMGLTGAAGPLYQSGRAAWRAKRARRPLLNLREAHTHSLIWLGKDVPFLCLFAVILAPFSPQIENVPVSISSISIVVHLQGDPAKV